MAFLRIDGLAVKVLIDDFDQTDSSVENYDRAMDDSLQGITYSVKREMSLMTEPMTVANARSLEGWVRGRKHMWSFDRVDNSTVKFSRYSGDGGLLLTSVSTLSSIPLFGTWALLLHTSAMTACATATFGSDGDWSVSVYHHPHTTASFSSYGVRSLNGVLAAFANGATVGTVGFLNLTASSGFLQVTLSGRTDGAGTAAGSTATSTFDNLNIYPYALTDAMMVSLASPRWGFSSQGPVNPPYVTVMGDALFEATPASTTFTAVSGEPGPLICKGFVDSIPTEGLVVGSFDYDARQLKVRLVQR